MNLIKRTTIFCVIIFAFNTAFAQKDKGFVTLKGQLKNFSNQVEVEDLSEFQYLLPPTAERIIVPDANGNFSIRFKASSPNYYRLGRNSMYLSPGDNLEVFIDKSNPKLASFKGLGAEANIYMQGTPFPKGGSYLEAGRLIKDTPEETIAAIEAAAAARKKELDVVAKISPEFRRLETARIKADLINSLYSMRSYGPMKKKAKTDGTVYTADDYVKAYEARVKELNQDFADASFMKMTVYRDIADEVVKQEGKADQVQLIKDWYKTDALVREMQKHSDKQELSLFVPKIAAIQTPLYSNAAKQMLQNLMAFGKNDPAVDFTAIDLAGKPVKLSSLKGKVIYVDLWATWCGPCMQEMPYFEKLKEKYKNNPNVAFVSLSIDDGPEVWKKSVKDRNAAGIQWQINRSKLDAYNIVGIPRVLLFDKTFKVADMNAPAPSEAATIKLIDELLQI
ncbi:TlpA family protein disulfide reductase [Pedobacter insulae]|uniref:Redoxin n=1 Tax=Pedobacter insulae TaxID=414048 RepID=A0A1I2TAN4_9SPHI|nr:TlpA disulfide reductase family protein [Pedobacter insulae]SFG61912.1 Redoxin [Pedobacter insulae]